MINQDRSTSTAHQEVVLRGDGKLTMADLAEIAAGNYAPGHATVRVAEYRPQPNEWAITFIWDEEQKLGLDDNGKDEPEEGPAYGERYQVVVPKKRVGETFSTTEVFDNRLPAEYTRNGSSQVIVSSAGDDYVLTARVLPTDNKSCGNIAVDGPCILPEGHVGDWCMNSAGNSWIPKHKQQEGAHEETEQENTPECGAEHPENGEWVCERPAGHHGDHADGYGGSANEWSQEPAEAACRLRKWCVHPAGHPGPHTRADGKRVLGDNPQA